ncbi:hypothetical protein HK103_006067 [Boothiomyces macroporosus]|uniref:Isocitrate dehydrogenase [NADP] n=1 Tax=Boothiomyces macroporosus TaxID=261099 RepID=A0AAD5Y2E1_9FUNG|nr:hypothetical protein HK103_006067 [Boothiomyces macroporosus]
MIRHVLFQKDSLPLLSTMDHEKNPHLQEYINMEKQLLQKVKSSITVKSEYNFHIFKISGFTILALTDHSYPQSLAFDFLQQIYNEYASSGIKITSRPYCLMKLEPTIQSLKQKYNQPKKYTAHEINIPKMELYELIPQKKLIIPKMPANWSTRLLFLLCLLLFYIDFTLCLNLAIAAYRIIRYNQHKLPGFQIILENPLIFMLGILSPFYIYLAIIYVQKKILSKNLKLVNMMHNNLVILQILIVLLVPKPGPEIMNATLKILQAARVPIEPKFVDMGKEFYLKGYSTGMTPEAKETVESTRILFKGPMETPKGSGVKSINVTARKVWSTFANKRVFQTLPGVETVFSMANIPIDLTLFRENIEDTYGGIEHFQSHDNNHKRVTCCHKANIMKLTDGLFLETFYAVAKEYPQIKADDIIVDDLAMKLVSRPDLFDVIVLPNLQGDIMSDLCAGLVGGLGMAPSANIGDDICIFEAVHGTAPDIAGKGVANPTALLLSSLMMLRHLGFHEKSEYIFTGLKNALMAGIRTGDLSQKAKLKPVSTDGFADGIIKNLPPQATQELFNFKLDFKPKNATKPLQNEMMVSPAPKSKKSVGMDIFIDTDLLPKALASVLEPFAKQSGLDLVMISNRGTQVWPTGSVFTQVVNHYRCRFQSKEEKQIEESVLLDLSSQIAKKLRVCSLEMLPVIDGLKKFSLAQGQ